MTTGGRDGRRFNSGLPDNPATIPTPSRIQVMQLGTNSCVCKLRPLGSIPARTSLGSLERRRRRRFL